MPNKDITTHLLGGKSIMQRESDGYFSATSMCKAAGKKLNDYKRLESTKDFIDELSSIAGIPVIELIKSYGDNRKMGTWVHPKVAIHLAQWLSPRFAVQVSTWVHDWVAGSVTSAGIPALPKAEKPLEHRIITLDPNTGQVHEKAFQGRLFIFGEKEFTRACANAVDSFDKGTQALRDMMKSWHDVEVLTKDGAERLGA